MKNEDHVLVLGGPILKGLLFVAWDFIHNQLKDLNFYVAHDQQSK